MKTDPQLAVTDLDVWRGDRCLLTGLSLRLGPGEWAQVVGPNGSGKTSLLRVLAGLSEAENGELAWPLDETTGLPSVAYYSHLDGLKQDLTVLENLRFFSRLAGRAHNGLRDVLTELGLGEHGNRLVRHLSAGQRRRTALARLRVQSASLWLLDEPFTNLDRQGRAIVEVWLKQHLQDRGLAVVATHHELAVAGHRQFRVTLGGGGAA